MTPTQKQMIILQLRKLLELAEQHLRTKIVICLFYEANYLRIKQDLAELQTEIDSINQQIKDVEKSE